MSQLPALHALALSGSPSANSRSRILLSRALAHLQRAGVGGSLLDLLDLPAEALLARQRDHTIDTAIEQVATAAILVLGTPIYRASYAAQLKAFFDLLPQDALKNRVVGLIATGAGPGHLLAVDHSLRPLVASLRGLSAANAVYVVDGQFPDKAQLPAEIDQQLRAQADELVALASSLHAR